MMNISRRRLYTEHKYVSAKLADFNRFAVRVDFAQAHEEVCMTNAVCLVAFYWISR